jgi:alkylation response protein AidB-like acyl-CoA dehydrogenase
MSGGKSWNGEAFWGVGFEYDPQWLLTEEQQRLQARLIELSATAMRANAEESDKGFVFPRKNFELLAKEGLLGLIVPKSLGGRGESHACAAMVVETIARYGCASTAMCYVMHLSATAALLLHHHRNPKLQDLLRRLDKEVLVGTLSISDPATGSHVWFLLSSSAEREGDGYRLHKKASWTTSGGYADWYVAQTTSPDFKGNYANFSIWLLLADEVKARKGSWNGVGLRGNQSGPMEIDGVVVPPDRLIGPAGDGAGSNDEATDPYFMLGTAACWNGVSMGAIDIVKRHTTRKTHADVGLKVADYPSIQDYVGNALAETNASRALTYQIAQAMDRVTNNNDWSIHEDIAARPRTTLVQWSWQVKYVAAKNVVAVTNDMMSAGGGTAYKPELGLERYWRDGRAGWLMAPTNEVLRLLLGKSALLGFEELDFWNQRANQRLLRSELKKLNPEERKALAEELLAPPA